MQHKSKTSQEEKKKEHYYILQITRIMRTRHQKNKTKQKNPKTSTSSKVTSLKVSAKVSRITTTANAHHKTTNASRDYEFHTMEKNIFKRSCIHLIDTVQRHHSISVTSNCVEMVFFEAPTGRFELCH